MPGQGLIISIIVLVAQKNTTTMMLSYRFIRATQYHYLSFTRILIYCVLQISEVYGGQEPPPKTSFLALLTESQHSLFYGVVSVVRPSVRPPVSLFLVYATKSSFLVEFS